MREDERDALLVRLDEKVINIYTLCEKQDEHLEKLNGKVIEAHKGMAINRTRIKMIMWGAGLLFGGGGIAGLIMLVS
tara:strand:+ start:112 stop:342 length:231 start_codon:yes stop_codon:yes gene_type:complete